MLQRPSSFSRPALAGVANQAAPLTEHSIREKREEEEGEQGKQHSLDALWRPGEHAGPLGHAAAVCGGSREEALNTWDWKPAAARH